MGIRYANCMPISNRCARKRATLCPVTKCYLKGEFNRLSWFKFQVIVMLLFAVQLYSFQSVGSAATERLYSFLQDAWFLAAQNQCFSHN